MTKKESPGGNQGKHSGTKDGTKISQISKVRKAFLSKNGKTMLMVSYETNIERANICRHVAKLRKLHEIRLIKRGFCPITKHLAGFLSTLGGLA
jgi:hypothetical protein